MQTFVVRVWVPGVEGSPEEAPLRGFVTDVSSGLTLPFLGGSELIGRVQEALRGGAQTAGDEGGRVWLEEGGFR